LVLFREKELRWNGMRNLSALNNQSGA